VAKRAFALPTRTSLILGRILIRPCAAAGSRWEPVIAAVCVALLGAVLAAELVTPDIVVGVSALLPLLAATWVLSNRAVAVVTVMAILRFGIAIKFEQANRITVILIGVVLLVTAAVARLYATGLASLLASRRHLRPTLPSPAMPPTLDGIGGSSHGLRSLTRRELEVARLAATGYTAAEMGHLLHVRDRTVESHLANTYSKLRINSRGLNRPGFHGDSGGWIHATTAAACRSW
jgi:DNA-binding CsgD family transcriptional regulator